MNREPLPTSGALQRNSAIAIRLESDCVAGFAYKFAAAELPSADPRFAQDVDLDVGERFAFRTDDPQLKS